MSIKDCVVQLVTDGKISQDVADDALSLAERMMGKVSRELPPASAEAGSALIAARTLRQAAADEVHRIASNVNAYQRWERLATEHPFGSRAAATAMFSRDYYRGSPLIEALPADSPVKQLVTVDGVREGTKQLLLEKFAAGVKYFKETKGKEAQASADRMIDEVKGVDTGDPFAKNLAAGWNSMVDTSVAMSRAAGRVFKTLEDWHFPQAWHSDQVRSIGGDEFKADVMNHLTDTGSGGIRLWNRDTGKPVMNPDERDFVLNRAIEDISRHGGPSEPFSREFRTFEFLPGKEGSDAYKSLMKKYGYGEQPAEFFMRHIDAMSSDIALTSVLGPNHAGNMRAIMEEVRGAPRVSNDVLPKWLGFIPNPVRGIARFMESDGMIDGLYKMASGQLHPIDANNVAYTSAVLRNLNTASKLRQAIFRVMPTDTVTSFQAANYVGMDGFSHLATMFTPGEKVLTNEDAAHFLYQSSHAADFINGTRQWENKFSLIRATAKLADISTKITGLGRWGRSQRETWAGNMLRHWGEHTGYKFDELGDVNANFKRYLDNYGFTADEWDKIRQNTANTDNGFTTIDPSALAKMDQGLYLRMMNSIQEQGAFAMHQADMRIRTIESGMAMGANSATSQAIAKSFFQYKTFALSRTATHLMRIMIDGDTNTRVGRGMSFLALGLAAGMTSIQAVQLLNGKDFRRMDKPEFWNEALVISGGAGYFGDLVESAMRGEKSGGDVLAELAGPAAQIAKDATEMAAAPIHEYFDDSQRVRRQTMGRKAVNVLKNNLPIRPWWAELGVERLFYDTLQSHLDPDYRKSGRRLEQMEEKRGGGYWWAPFDKEPRRGPAYPPP